MPCRDYEDYGNSNDSALRDQNDRLARIACKAMQELTKLGKEDFLLLQDDEVREWWAAHQKADAAEAKRKLERARRVAERAAAKAAAELAKKTALAKLSPEDRKALGL